MKRKTEYDWTDELRQVLDGASMTPSEEVWERLQTSVPVAGRSKWPYALACACAACLILGLFLFRSPENATEILPEIKKEMAVDLSVKQETTHDDDVSIEIVETAKNHKIQIEPVSDTLFIAEAPAEEPMADSAELVTQQTEAILEDGPAEQPDTSVSYAGVSSPRITHQSAAAEKHHRELSAENNKKRHRPVSISISAGGTFGAGSTNSYIAAVPSSSFPATRSIVSAVTDISNVLEHSIPVRTSLDLLIPVSGKFDIHTGLDHSSMSSHIGSNVCESLSWLGIPLRVGYRAVGFGKSDLSFTAGILGERCMSASLLGKDYAENVQWSANLDARLSLHIAGPVGFVLIPELSYYFTETVLPTYRSSLPLTFTVRAGLFCNLQK